MSGTCVRRGPAPRASGRGARTWSAAGVELASSLAYKGELNIARTRGVDRRDAVVDERKRARLAPRLGALLVQLDAGGPQV